MSADYQRLSVNINSECAEALRRIRDKREISVTEAIRRAIGVLDMLDRQKDAEEVRALGGTLRDGVPMSEPTPGYNAWEEWWMSLTPEQRAEEIRAMDEHVAFTEREPEDRS